MGVRILGDIEIPTDAVSAGMVEEGWKHIKEEVLRKNGDTAMEVHLNLNNHWIVNLDLSVRVNDAANKKYVDGQMRKSIMTIIAEDPLGKPQKFQWSFGSNSDGISQTKKGYIMIKKILAMSLSASQSYGNSEEMASVGVTVGGNYQFGYDMITT